MKILRTRALLAVLVPALLAGCASEAATPASGSVAEGGTPSPLAQSCDPDDGGLILPQGFCALVVIDSLGPARHLEVAPNGDIFVALRDSRARRGGEVTRGGVAALRDSDGDGRADVVERFGEVGGNDVLLHGGWLYFAPNDGVLRYPLPEGSLQPSGPAETLVRGLPDTRNHTAKSIAVTDDGSLFVNIGSPSNACMRESRTPGSPGQDPCPQLERRAGIWRFDADRAGQTQDDGVRFATGLRNVVALALDPFDGELYGVMHGRDQLHDMWPDLFTVDQSTEKPSEEFVHITEGADFGWPYCYHDPETGRKVLAPEYGGDGTEIGRCADKAAPILGFPAHWAPNDLVFYGGDQFPNRYREGAFIAFHGSWNRAPNPQDGYRVVFVPRNGDTFGPEWDVFADGFRREGVIRSEVLARPVGLAVGPDGSLYISDSLRGRIWRVLYRGS